MAAPSRPRGAAAKDALLDAAERLFAERGLAGASLREIAAAAGQANNYAVQYHFGDKDRLVAEIFRRRLAGLDERRRAMLDGAGPAPGIPALLDVLIRPLFEVTDRTGRHVYAAFVAQYLATAPAPVADEAWEPDIAGATRETVEGLRRAAGLPPDLFALRIGAVTLMFLGMVAARDQAVTQGRPVPPADAFLAEMTAMMAAALTAHLSRLP